MSKIPPKFEEAIGNSSPYTPYTPYTPTAKTTPAPQFPTGALPKTVERLVTEAAAAIGCPPDAIALAALTTLGSAIGNSRVIQPKKGWVESALIYAAVIADSGEKKTAAIAVATDPAQRLQNKLWRTSPKRVASTRLRRGRLRKMGSLLLHLQRSQQPRGITSTTPRWKHSSPSSSRTRGVSSRSATSWWDG
jgi:Protein of unknown function (DUF3987)